MNLQSDIDCWGSSSQKPNDPQNGIVDQRKRAVMFKFVGRSSFNVVLKTYAGDGQSNYLFAGRSSLVSTCTSAPTTTLPVTTTLSLATSTTSKSTTSLPVTATSSSEASTSSTSTTPL